MNKLLCVVGATGTGKTGLGIKLAQEFSGEIVSADSRQVYKYLDIGTGKDLSIFASSGIRVWLYDAVDPKERFSAVEYAKLAWNAIKDIWQRKKLPILVGGTGFYIRATLEGIDTRGIPADWELRGQLEKLTVAELQKRLKALNKEKWESMNESDRHNPRRLVRAIEIAKSGINLTTTDSSSGAIYGSKLEIGLTADNDVLYKRIDERVEKRVKQGIIDEISDLLAKGYTWDDPGMNTLGYKEWKPYFENKATQEEVIQKWKYDEHAYARRQLTWFKKQKNIRWYDISEANYVQKVTKAVGKWYYNNN